MLANWKKRVFPLNRRQAVFAMLLCLVLAVNAVPALRASALYLITDGEATTAVELAEPVTADKLIVVGAAPVKAAGMSVTASTSATVEAGSRFAAKINITGASVKGTTADVTITGLGSITDTVDKTVAFDANGSASFTVSLTYSGEGSPSILVEVGGDSADCGVSGYFIPRDDGNDQPAKPSGNSFAVKDGTALPSISAGETKKLVLPIVNTTSRRFSYSSP